MEHLGLVRALQFLTDNSLEVATLVTDGHNQIAKYIAEKKPEIKHLYDVWYMSKSMWFNYTLQDIHSCKLLQKKMSSLAKTKECSVIGEWIKQLLLMGMTSSGDGSPVWITFATSTMIATMTL